MILPALHLETSTAIAAIWVCLSRVGTRHRGTVLSASATVPYGLSHVWI